MSTETCSLAFTLRLAERVTAQIKEALQRGVRPWAPPYCASPTLPRRSTGEPYRGINVPTLWATALAKGYSSPFWFTFKQANALGAHVRRGETGAFVVYYSPADSAPPLDGAEDDQG